MVQKADVQSLLSSSGTNHSVTGYIKYSGVISWQYSVGCQFEVFYEDFYGISDGTSWKMS